MCIARLLLTRRIIRVQIIVVLVIGTIVVLASFCIRIVVLVFIGVLAARVSTGFIICSTRWCERRVTSVFRATSILTSTSAVTVTT